ncbi:MAG: TonB-dependent receptor [Terracidiphilus sp.]|nr:TonB-dependent receptor [Terracidiphilus sp.]
MNRTHPFPFVALFFLSSSLLAQTAQTPVAKPIKTQPETLVVLGSATPVPLAESTRSVAVLPVRPMSLAAESPLDLLRTTSSAFLEQRGAGGAQSDLVLRGGSFAQTLVLLNGFRINDSQAAHHNLDLPITLDAMDSIQVLPGAGSTLHGIDALSGVVDFLTAAPDHASLRLRAAQGSFQSNEESLVAGAVHDRWSGRFTASRNFSEGFRADRDYRNEDASTESWLSSSLGLTDVFVAASDRSFGADQFYGNYNSWERTKGWFAAARQELGTRTTAAFAYRRHTDEFILLRNNPAYYENNHVDRAWQASLRHTVPIPANSLILVGLEADGDSIQSSSLGKHARNRGAGYIDLDLHPSKRRWTLSAGAREEVFSGGTRSFAPQLSASLRAASALKLRASAGYGFRIPTYTDLYYSDPATLGNARLKPESAWNGEGGADWTPSQKLTLSATGFYSRQHNAIDYVRASSAAKWQAANLSGLHFAGFESSLAWFPVRTQTVRLSWTALHGAQGALNGLQSKYIYNYPVQSIHAAWTAQLPHTITITNAVQIAERYQQTVYPVWNATVTRDASRLRPYLRFANLSNTGYEEISGVLMPSRSITGGFALQFGR